MKSPPCAQGATASAADRFFRAYEIHCVAPNADSLFNLLNALHSLNDKMIKEHKNNFFDLKEFVALQTLRNLFHHQSELLNDVRIIPVAKLPPITTDLLFLCLTSRALVEKAIDGIPKKRKPKDELMTRKSLKWYGNVVNINPCIFNFAVHVYEKMKSLKIDLESEAHAVFQESYDFEKHAGHSHFISGDIACHAGSVTTVLEIAFTNVI